jgi:hypothetical protein
MIRAYTSCDPDGRFNITKNSVSYFIELVFYLFFIGIYYLIAFIHPDSIQINSFWLKCLIFGLPVCLIPKLIENIKIFLNGEIIVIDPKIQEILKNGKTLAFFSEVDFLQLRSKPGADGEIWYKLNIMLKDRRKIKVIEEGNYDHIWKLATDIAKIFDVYIIKK